MADSIPDLWSDAINLDDLSPIIILNSQAANIQNRTKGLIVAELIQRKSKNVTELFFDIKSLAARHRSRLLVCRHLDDDVYPVWITSQALYQAFDEDYAATPSNPFNLDFQELQSTMIADGQEEFIRLLSKVLKSDGVKSKISSMIAKNNEIKQSLDHLIVEEVLSESQTH